MDYLLDWSRIVAFWNKTVDTQTSWNQQRDRYEAKYFWKLFL